MNRQVHVEVLVPEAPGREPKGMITLGDQSVVYRCADEERALLAALLNEGQEVPLEFVTAE